VTGVATAMLDGRPVAVTSSWDKTAQVWDLADAETITTYTGHADAVVGVATAMLDGRPVAVTVSWDTTAHIWDLATGRRIGKPLAGPARRLANLVRRLPGRNSRLGRRLGEWTSSRTLIGVATALLDGRPVAVTASLGKTARVWDLARARTIAIYSGHDISVTGVATTTLDGRAVAVTTSWDQTVQTWDLATGRTISTFTGHDMMVEGVAVATFDGHPAAITFGVHNTARVWDLTGAVAQLTLTFPDAVTCAVAAADGIVIVGMGHEVIALTLISSPGRPS
jgi:WD40 repeat protein